MNDTTLTESKDVERDFEEAVAQLEQDSKSQFFKGVGILILFLAICGGFVGGALWAADKVSHEVKTSFGEEDYETLSTRQGIRP